MTENDDRIHMPSNPKAEWGLVLGKSAVSLIPFAGGPAAEVLGAIITPQIEKRKTAWLEGLAQDLYELSAHVADLTPERLAENVAFTTAFLHASQIAVHTHQVEKLNALRNAVLHVAVEDAPDDSLQLIFLEALDALTPWHLMLLDCIADPVAWAARRKYPLGHGHMPDAPVIFGAVYRDLMPAEGFHFQLLQDLYNRGFAANNVNPVAMLHSPEETIPHLTDLGRKFLAFVAAPTINNDGSGKGSGEGPTNGRG